MSTTATTSTTSFAMIIWTSSTKHPMSRLTWRKNGMASAPAVIILLTSCRRLGSLVTPAEKEEGLQKMNVFRRWFSEHVMTGDETTVSSAVMILPLGRGEPWYRDVPVEVPYRGPGYSSMNLAHMLHLPQVVFPSKHQRNIRLSISLTQTFAVGQFPYHSRITENIEYLPISTSLAGAPGRLQYIQLRPQI